MDTITEVWRNATPPGILDVIAAVVTAAAILGWLTHRARLIRTACGWALDVSDCVERTIKAATEVVIVTPYAPPRVSLEAVLLVAKVASLSEFLVGYESRRNRTADAERSAIVTDANAAAARVAKSATRHAAAYLLCSVAIGIVGVYAALQAYFWFWSGVAVGGLGGIVLMAWAEIGNPPFTKCAQPRPIGSPGPPYPPPPSGAGLYA